MTRSKPKNRVRKPHKCPVCLGMCEILDDRATDVVVVRTIPCPACFGSGIVWEPEFSHPVRVPKEKPNDQQKT